MSDDRWNRRELLRAGAGLGLAAYGLGGLAGCTVERPIDSSAAAEVVVPKIDGDLHIYNWAQYMDPSLKKTFSDRYGVNVFESNFDNLEAMLTKIRSGASYDVIFPSGEYVDRMRQEGLLRPFDRSPPSQHRQRRALLRQLRGTTRTRSSPCRTRTTRPASAGAPTRSPA